MANKTMIFVHTLAVRPDWMKDQSVEAKVAEVTKWHVRDNGWRDIGYAAVIDRDGSVGWGRDLDNDGDVWEETAAAAKNYNSVGVHIALVGGFGGSANDKFSDHYTLKQDVALRKLIRSVEMHFNKPMWVRGHNEVAAKACPCFQVEPWYKDEEPRSILGSKTLQGAGATVAGGVGATATAVSSLDDTAQVIFMVAMAVVLVGAVIVFRERIKAWANGRK